MKDDQGKEKEPGRLLTIADVGWLLSMNGATAKVARREDPLFPPPITIGKHERWLRADIDAYIAAKRLERIAQAACRFNPESIAKNSAPASDIPESLLSLAGSLSEYAGFAHAHCVYFLLQEQVVVYVGKTQQIGVRVGQHLKGSSKSPKKNFDRVLYLSVEAGGVDAAEAYYIKLLNPFYNRAGVEKDE